MELIISIPNIYITASYINLEEDLWIIGTIEGQIIKINYNIQENTANHELVYSSTGEVRSINKLSDTELIILFKTGEIALLISEDNQNFNNIRIEQGYNTRYTRSYRLEVYNENEFFVTGNYGIITHYWRNTNNEWDSKKLGIKHERNAIFCLGRINENTFLTSDWNGILNIWEFSDNKNKKIQTIYTKGNMQKLTINPDSSKLAIINRSGNFYYYEGSYEEGEIFYQEIFENQYPEGRGKAISFLDESDTIFIGTSKKLYKFDLEQDILYYMSEDYNCVDLYPLTDSELMLVTTNSLYKINKSNINQTDEDIESYEILKIGLIGHTGVGKSSLCNFIVHGFKPIKEVKIEPTFYKQIWFWNNPSGHNSKKIIFHDVAGQQELIPSHIPQMIDSDVILALFKSTDTNTFDKLKDFIELIREYYEYEKPIILVKTFKDKKLDLLDESILNDFKEHYNITQYISTTITEENGANELKSILVQDKLWEKSHKLYLSFTSASFLDLFDEIFYEEISLITLHELQALMEHPSSDSILVERLKSKGRKAFSRSNLLFVLKKYSKMRLIDYDKNSQILIFNNLTFNYLRVSIPTFAKLRGGVISIDEIKNKFSNIEQDLRKKYKDPNYKNRLTKEIKYLETYIDLIDKEFIESKICIQRDVLRIFWPYLSEKPIIIPKKIKDLIFGKENTEEGLITFKEKRLKLRNLNDGDFIEEILDLELGIINIRENEGLFGFDNKQSFLYFHYTERRERGGFNYELNYYIYGEDKLRNYIIEKRILEFFKRFEEDNLENIKGKALNNNSTAKKLILICVSSPYGPPHIMVDKDPQLIGDLIKIYGENNFLLEELNQITFEKLKKRVEEKSIPYIFQFSGHGKYSESTEPHLLFEDANRDPIYIGKEQFCNCLEGFNSHTNLVLFNACESYEFALEINKLFNIPSIGIRNDINDKSAYHFIEGFYVGIIKYNFDFEEAVKFGVNLVNKIRYDDISPHIIYLKK